MEKRNYLTNISLLRSKCLAKLTVGTVHMKVSLVIRSLCRLMYTNLPRTLVHRWMWRIFRQIPEPESDRMIYCIGDSHANFFSGYDDMLPSYPQKSQNLYPFFKAYRLGAVLAHNLCKLKAKTRGREKLFTILFTGVPVGSYVLLCFGEIDCRVHLLHIAQERKRMIEDVVNECVDRYYSVIKEIKQLGYRPIIWNVIPSTNLDLSEIPEFPTYGTLREIT
jgi:hypothetical protein